jgi:hypothetical protein
MDAGDMTRLNISRPPRLPTAPQEYETRFHDQHSDVLRLYFNQIDNALAALLGPNGGQFIGCPNGLFFNTADQALAAINTAYPVVFNQTYLNNAVSLTSSSQITVSVGGIYNIQYSGQVLTTSGSAKTLYLWIRRNGTDIGYSTRAYTLDVNNSLSDVSWAFNIDLDAGEYIELIVAKDALGVQLEARTATAPHPGIPSSVVSVNFVAPLPTPRPTPP